MSYNVMNYAEAWGELRKAVSEARADYLKKVALATPYLPSKQAEKDIEKAEHTYTEALEAARKCAAPKFNKALEGMRSVIAKPDMRPPTPDMLATLRLFELRDDIEAEEAEAAARVMGNNDAALKTLRDVLMRKGRPLPSSVKTVEAQARDAVDELARAAGALLQWDGRDGRQILSDYFEKRNNHLYGDGEHASHSELASRFVADVKEGAYFMETIRNIVGDEVPLAVLEALDD